MSGFENLKRRKIRKNIKLEVKVLNAFLLELLESLID